VPVLILALRVTIRASPRRCLRAWLAVRERPR
jgi:hypothetical protein